MCNSQVLSNSHSINLKLRVIILVSVRLKRHGKIADFLDPIQSSSGSGASFQGVQIAQGPKKEAKTGDFIYWVPQQENLRDHTPTHRVSNTYSMLPPLWSHCRHAALLFLVPVSFNITSVGSIMLCPTPNTQLTQTPQVCRLM